MNMKYFVTDSERIGTNYYEFYKGKWDGETFWKEDSISVHDNVLYENQGFVEAIIEVKHSFDAFGVTEISPGDWKNIGEVILQKDCNCQELYFEADDWVQDVFKTYDCFTILGI